MDNISIRCVAYFDQEENNWCAVALDLDIVTEGNSQEEVVDDLNKLIEAQISFAAAKGDISMIWRKAPQEYWDKYEEMRQRHMRELLGREKHVDDGFVSDRPFPDAAALELSRAAFV